MELVMSRTDKDRPYRVQETDRLNRFIGGNPVYAGRSGFDGHAKRYRKILNGKQRQRDRKFKHDVLSTPRGDTDIIDVVPVRGDRKTVPWDIS